MAKAYDRVSWDFLRKILSRFGFQEAWINLVMQCVETIDFSVSINGVLTSYFKPQKGLRQGDPISPYLFILMAEYLSRLILNEQQKGNIKGIRITKHCPPMTHSQFADDTVVFGELSALEIQSILAVLIK